MDKDYFKQYRKKHKKVLDEYSRKYRYSIQSWSKSVKNRDYKTCQNCGFVGSIAHHILHKSKYPKLSLNLDNGITLCKKCHNECHGFNTYKPQKDTNYNVGFLI